jgi:hypothetical protein
VEVPEAKKQSSAGAGAGAGEEAAFWCLKTSFLRRTSPRRSEGIFVVEGSAAFWAVTSAFTRAVEDDGVRRTTFWRLMLKQLLRSFRTK